MFLNNGIGEYDLKKISLYLLLAIIFISMAGCLSVQTVSSEQPSLPAETATLEAFVPSPTPVPTTAPEPSPTPTPQPTPEQKGKKVIADGFYYYELNDELKERITGMSYPPDDKDCQVQYDDLRYIRLKYYDFDGNEHNDGELIVNYKVAEEVTQIFYELYKEKYQMTSVRLVDDFKQPADDTKSMEANNTSAFCYRRVTGNKKMSLHSFGCAIDINPQLNPYIVGDRIAPENGAQYADRSKDFEGKIDKNDLAYKLFKQHGWRWGGTFSDRDYQHFDKNLGYDRYKP